MQSVTVWMTENCNLKCKYCYEGQEKREKKFDLFHIDTLTKFIDREIFDSNEKNEKVIISFHGGEPLLEFQSMKKIVQTLDKISLKKAIPIVYEITTNGNANEMEFLEFIKNREDFRISVSLDGNKETNDFFRVTRLGESSFYKAFKFAKHLLQMDKYPRIRMTLTPKTVDCLYENIVFFIEEGFTMIVTVPDFFDKEWKYGHLKKLKKQLHKLNEYQRTLQPQNVQISLLDESFFLKKVGRCFGGLNEINISCDGLLYPCTYTMNNTKYCIGNIWEGIDTKKQKKLLTMYTQNNVECSGCGLESACISTRCKFLNEAITGNCNTPVPIICAFMNIIYHFFRDVNTNSQIIVRYQDKTGGIKNVRKNYN